jgi:hypothetical protein
MEQGCLGDFPGLAETGAAGPLVLIPMPIFPAKRQNLPDPDNFFPVLLHREL